MKKIKLAIDILIVVSVVALITTACAPLVVRQPVLMPVVQDGKTNNVPINGYVPGPLFDAVKPVAGAFPPYGDLALVAATAALAIYTRIKNQKELAAHIDEFHTDPPPPKS